jgi:hypothetical protein
MKGGKQPPKKKLGFLGDDDDEDDTFVPQKLAPAALKKNAFDESDGEDEGFKPKQKAIPAQTLKPPIKNKLGGSDSGDDFKPATKT